MKNTCNKIDYNHLNLKNQNIFIPNQESVTQIKKKRIAQAQGSVYNSTNQNDALNTRSSNAG